MSSNKVIKNIHLALSGIIFVPVGAIVISGIFLLFRSSLTFMSPTAPTSPVIEKGVPPIALELAIKKFESSNALGFKKSNIKALQYNFDKGIIDLRTDSDYQFFISAYDGHILSYGKKRSLWFHKIHETFLLNDYGKKLIIIPTAISLFVLWGTGIFMLIPIIRRKFSHVKRLPLRSRDRVHT